jgi:WD40 repeat protein
MKLEIASMKCGLQAGDELAAEDTAEHVDGEEEAAGGTDPAVTVWSQSAGGPPRQITNFPDSVIAYDWSPDGKQLGYTRYASISDVVLISSFR